MSEAASEEAAQWIQNIDFDMWDFHGNMLLLDVYAVSWSLRILERFIGLYNTDFICKKLALFGSLLFEKLGIRGSSLLYQAAEDYSENFDETGVLTSIFFVFSQYFEFCAH